MSFNIGYFIAIKRSLTGGGVLKLEHIDGSDQSAPQRGLQPRGTSVGVGALQIYSPHVPSSALQYPLTTKFSAEGIAILQFLYDFSSIPRTVAGPSGILATPCRYSIGGVGGHSNVVTNGQLLHFSNVANFKNASPHFRNPSVPIPLPSLQRALDDATDMARRLSAITNSLSRHTLAGIVFV